MGSRFSATLLTPSSISILRNSLVRALPNRRAIPTVRAIMKRVEPRLNEGLISIPPDLKDMNPTASRTKGTESTASVYPANHANRLITASSSRIMLDSVPSVPPITR